MEKLKLEEEERLCILAEPLRQYLMEYVFPTLTEALIEVAKLRPEDPIDFLVSIYHRLLSFINVPDSIITTEIPYCIQLRKTM